MTIKSEHKRSNYPPNQPDTHEPLFQCGDILRYSDGETALFQVEYISPKHGGSHRYYGQHCMGGSHAAYEYGSQLAEADDYKTWIECEKWRRPYKEKDRSAVGSYED